ncbi:type III pantothenate kinase [Nocardia camponoti]|uniref:Type III pantothenate kinase n=1 Tax=Nocardia camponoti TaxID=1616106 RepID=A0A917VB54_9NOCA|nr:type III pantothenate kinase [Nocardia camponoti]GGK60263.1 type III pantothenate kinase [Nocardia camponoti]
MLLTIDVRNTGIELGLFSGSGEHATLARHWRIHTNPLLTADELAVQVRGLIGDADLAQVVGVSALSTVPPVLRELRTMLTRYWSHTPHVVVEPGVRTGIPLLVDNPKEVGADRIVNCLAAYRRFGGPAIVVDFGTAICVDLVSAKGEFLGGVIAPGVEISTEALVEKSALRRVELARPRSVLGKNSAECMQSGAVFGFAGLVDGIIDRVRDEFDAFAGKDVTVVATGAGAPLIVPESETIDEHEPHLTLTGLRLVYERNKK